MKNYYSISIPKPCHEDWNMMNTKEKGRFCNSCAKTVIDFTKMDTYQIQDFLNENRSNRICGHFKQTQLDSINIYIPSQILEQQQNFHKLFLLVLLIVMGTSLMNCTNKNGDTQKIDSVEIINYINSLGEPLLKKADSIPEKTCTERITKKEEITETLGDIEVIEPPITYEPVDPVGIITYEKEDTVIGLLFAESPPEFLNTPSNLSIQEKRDYFSKQITNIVSKNFNTSVCLNLRGKQRVDTQFKINDEGYIIDIKARAPHPKLEEEAKRVIQLLPKFIPAKQRDKFISVVYTLPIIFQAE